MHVNMGTCISLHVLYTAHTLNVFQIEEKILLPHRTVSQFENLPTDSKPHWKQFSDMTQGTRWNLNKINQRRKNLAGKCLLTTQPNSDLKLNICAHLLGDRLQSPYHFRILQEVLQLLLQWSYITVWQAALSYTVHVGGHADLWGLSFNN
jgi:hypothetical protein